MNPPQTEEIRLQVEERIQYERETLGAEEKKEDSISSDFVQQCFQLNELGDGYLYAALNKDRFIYDATAGEWLRWSGHFWQKDITDESLPAVEDIARLYFQEAKAVGRQISETADEEDAERLQKRQSRFMRRVNKLRSIGGRQNCRTFAATCGEGSLVVTGDKLDSEPWLLPCKTGVVDLRTGLIRPGRPSEFLTMAAPVEFPEDCGDYLATGENSPCPTWEAFVLEVLGGDQAKADYLCRLFGYSITGSVREHVFAVLYGNGRNGKGTMLETLQSVLGPLAAPVASELLLDQGRASNPAGPSPHLMALRGLRLAFCSETDQGRRFSAARVKWLSGGDSLTGRNPHDRAPSTFPPSHLLCLATNHKPRADAADFAFWSRLHLIEFGLSYVERPSAAHERKIDKTLPERLKQEESGILAWLVRGCLLWQKEGLNPPPSVLAATAEYRRSEDMLADWIDEKCTEAQDAKTTAKAAYQSFKEWWSANISDKVPSQRRFGDDMAKRGFQKDRGGPGGTKRYLGIELRDLL